MTAALQVNEALLRAWPLPEPAADGDKESRGTVAVVGGSVHMPGAVLLTAEACLRSGAGRVQIFTDDVIARTVAVRMPEAWVGVLGPGYADHGLLARCDALVIGPGLADAEAGARAGALLAEHIRRVPTVLDAFALAGARALAAGGAKSLVLTPHAGEMARLVGLTRREVQTNAPVVARGLAMELAAVVVLKGPRTWIAGPDGRAWLSTAGGIGLGTAGSGDVLAGIVAGLLAQGVPAVQAAVWATHLHGICGEQLAKAQGSVGFLARELLPLIPRVRAQLSDD